MSMIYFALIIPAVQIHLLVLLLATKNIHLAIRLPLFILGFLMLINNSFFALATDMKLRLIRETYGISYWGQFTDHMSYTIFTIAILAVICWLMVKQIHGARDRRIFTYLSTALLFFPTLIAMTAMYNSLGSVRDAEGVISEEAAARLIYSVFAYLFIAALLYLFMQMVAVIRYLREKY